MANEIKLAILRSISNKKNIPVSQVTNDMIKEGVDTYLQTPEQLKLIFKNLNSSYTNAYSKLLDLGTAEQNERYLNRWKTALKYLPSSATATYTLTNNSDK